MNTKVLFSVFGLTVGAIHTLNVPIYAASSTILEVDHAELIAEAKRTAQEVAQAIVKISTCVDMQYGELEKPELCYLNAMIELQKSADNADRATENIIAVVPESAPSVSPLEVIKESRQASAELSVAITQAEQTIMEGSPEKLSEFATRQAYEKACARASLASVAAQLTAINYAEWISTIQQQQP